MIPRKWPPFPKVPKAMSLPWLVSVCSFSDFLDLVGGCWQQVQTTCGLRSSAPASFVAHHNVQRQFGRRRLPSRGGFCAICANGNPRLFRRSDPGRVLAIPCRWYDCFGNQGYAGFFRCNSWAKQDGSVWNLSLPPLLAGGIHILQKSKLRLSCVAWKNICQGHERCPRILFPSRFMTFANDGLQIVGNLD